MDSANNLEAGKSPPASEVGGRESPGGRRLEGSKGEKVHPPHHHSPQHNHGHGQQHTNERLRVIEDRLEGFKEQLAETQHMIREISDTLRRQAQSSTARTNLRTLSGRILQHGHHHQPKGTPNQPPAKVKALLTRGSGNNPAEGATMDGDGTHLDASIATSGDENAMVPTPGDDDIGMGEPNGADVVQVRKVSTTDVGSRRLSASNPVALQGEKKKPSMVHALAIAAVRLGEMSKDASTKVRPPEKISDQHNKDGPAISRRFSLSSLDMTKSRESRLSWMLKLSRTIFKKRVEPAVSPEEIYDARATNTKIHPLTIRHDSRARMLWEAVVMTMIVVDIVFTPLNLSFNYDSSWLEAFNAVATVVFSIDFIVNMFSSFTTVRGELISGPNHTIPHYLLSPWSIPDFLSWFPFESIIATDQGRFLGVAKVIRLAKLSQLARRFHSAKKAGFFRLVKLLGIVFIVSHCLSCYWNWVAVVWREEEDGYLEKSLSQKYAHCWSMIIGSLNASPPVMHTPVEEVSVAFFMLIGNVLQATVFGSVAVLISSFDEEEVAYNKKLISTYERCRFLGIPVPLANRIQGYYENLYRETHSVSADADSFINELSPALICEVKFQLYREMIKQIPFLSATHINPVVIEMLILHLRTVIYMQDDVLVRKGEFGDWMGFIGSKGCVGVLDPKADGRKIIRILRKGDYFGEMALLHRAKRSTTAVALTWVQIHVLCRSDLDDVKDQYPEQAEILEEEIIKYMKSKVTYK